MQLKPQIRRAVSGLLTASMVMSLLTSAGITASAESETMTAIHALRQDAVALRETFRLETKDGNSEIPMPLVLDKSTIGFTAEADCVEVTAYMTDIQYLGLLTIQEYAAFIPASVDMDKVTYLDRDGKDFVAAMTEEERLQLRAEAEAKLQLEEQFIWEAFWNEVDYSDKLEITPTSWHIREADEENAPMIACTVEIRWIGEKKVNYVYDTSGSSNDLSSLLGDGNSTVEAGSKSIYDESPEVQAFLREMYLSGGLTQENSPYDLSVFDNEKTTEESTGGGFNLMGGSSEGDSSEPTTEPNNEESDLEDADESDEQPEDEIDVKKDEAQTEDGEEGDSDDVNEKENESKIKDENDLTDEENENDETTPAEEETNVDDGSDDAVDVEDNEVPLAPNPDDGEGAAEEGEIDETEDVEMPDDGDDENHDHDADDDIDLDSAIFSVRMKANETIVAVGAAYYIPSTQTIPGPSNDNDNTDDKTDDTQQPENPDANNPGEEELPDGEIPKGTLTEEELAELAAIAAEIGLSEEELNELMWFVTP